AIVCALPHEAAAVRALFDHCWPAGFGNAPFDPNAYTTGLMSGHNVVLIHLAQMGNNPAAIAAQACQQSFPNIQLVLVVGVCGGVPQCQGDTFLGDVIISDSVLQYDFGRHYGDRLVPKTDLAGSLSRPNLKIRALLNKLRTFEEKAALRRDLQEYMSLLSSQAELLAHYPGERSDLLFRAAYVHKHRNSECSTCDRASGAGYVCDEARVASCTDVGCDPVNVVLRQRPPSEVPSNSIPDVHVPQVRIGPVASGDSVIKSGEYRDMISQSTGVIAFEMESAGVWDIFPCLVIKGVCDYSDSHKNKRWQPYAAAAAAACIKAFLQRWESTGSVRPYRRPASLAAPQSRLTKNQREEMMTTLRFKQMDARLLTLRSAQTRTCHWLKSLVLPFFFNARGETLEKSTLGLYRSLLLQLLEKAPETQSSLEAHDGTLYSLVKDIGWQDECLKDVLRLAVQSLASNKCVVCFVDALDECPEDEIRSMVAFFEEVGRLEKSAEIRVCFSSRHYPEITIRTGLQITLELNPSHSDDIRLYIDTNLTVGNSVVTDDIKIDLIRKSSGIFLWVALVVPMLNKAYDKGRLKALKQKLHEIPAGLHELFRGMLTRDGENTNELLCCVRFVLFAARPLTPTELLSAVEIETELNGTLPQPGPRSDDATTQRRRIIDISKGLAEITISSHPTVQFIHESVRDFLEKSDWLHQLFSTSSNFEAQSHETLKRLCFLHLRCNDACFSSACRPSLMSHYCYPLKGYALNHVLSHANSAHELGLNQGTFLETEFQLNIFLEAQGERNQTSPAPRVHLVYCLAAAGHAALIRLLKPGGDAVTLVELKRCMGAGQFPVACALWRGHVEAAYALLGLPSPTGDFLLDSKATLTGVNQELVATRTPSVIPVLCQYGDIVLIEAALNLGVLIDSETAAACIQACSSEAVVELLARRGFFDILSLKRERKVSSLDCLQRNSTKSKNDLFEQITNKKHWECGGLWLGGLWLSPLQWAARKGFKDIVKVCYKAADFQELQWALWFAVGASGNQTDRSAVIPLLFESGLQLPESFCDGLLSRSIENPDNEQVFEALLAELHRSQKNVRQMISDVLRCATTEGRKTYMKLILAARKDRDYASRSMLMEDVTTGGPLTFAIRLDDRSSFCHLSEHPDNNVNAVDRYGRTALSWAAAVADDEMALMVQTLTTFPKARIDANIVDNSGQTALIRAVRSGNPMIVQAVLAIPGIDPARGKCGGLAALQLAVKLCRWNSYKTYWHICHLLLEIGKADPNFQPGRTKSALTMAKEYGLTELVTLMESFNQYGCNAPEFQSMEWHGTDSPWPHLGVIQRRWASRGRQ
ncbi:uncharacterized protein B0I36DRAFT_398007, partial [Microdochium trichocladiopsis]